MKTMSQVACMSECPETLDEAKFMIKYLLKENLELRTTMRTMNEEHASFVKSVEEKVNALHKNVCGG